MTPLRFLFLLALSATSSFAGSADGALDHWRQAAGEIAPGTSRVEIERRLPVCQYPDAGPAPARGIRLLSYPRVTTKCGSGKVLCYRVTPEIVISMALNTDDTLRAPIQVRREAPAPNATATP